MRLETPPFLFMNGNVVPWAEAQIHIWSETAVRATNVFEGLHACWLSERQTWRVIAWRDHLQRLASSARLMRIPHEYSEAYFSAAVRELLQVLSIGRIFMSVRRSLSNMDPLRRALRTWRSGLTSLHSQKRRLIAVRLS